MIAEYAAESITEGDVIYLDAGTTTSEMIPFPKNRTITVCYKLSWPRRSAS